MSSPKDMLAQRNKLQNEILAMETSLGNNSNVADLLSSDSESTDDSDDSGHAGEEGLQKNLEEERQQIQKEIKELEETLGAEAALVDVLTDSEHGTNSHADSSDDDDELVLPQNMETCLQMNLVYQEVLKEKLSELERLLNDNRQQQKDLEARLSGPASASPGLPQLRLFLGSFMKPYFKDKLSGLGPPANEETKEKLMNGTKICDKIKIKRWEAWQKTLLVKAVTTDTMKRMLQPKMSKIEYLTTKLSKAKDEDGKELKKLIGVLEKDIAQISSMKEEELYGNRHDDHDWDKISNIDFECSREPEDLKRFWQNYLHPSINKTTWKDDEIKKLGEVAAQFNCRHWDQIAEALGTNRTAFMCFQIYQRYISKSFKKREWTKEEDLVLIELVEKMRIGNFIPYTQMAYFMEGRDYSQLIYRWTGVLDPSLKKGQWTKEEDELLRNAVKKYGCKEWWKIKNEVPGRTDGACRDRYLDCLREGVKRGPWSNEEVELLKKLIEKHGVGKWSKIAAEIPNRLDCQCLNKWKWMKRQLAISAKNTTSKRGPPPKKNRIKKEEDYMTGSDSSSEAENENVEYMDSDSENAEEKVFQVEDLPPRRGEYIQPVLNEWIPVDRRAEMHSERHVKSVLVVLPNEEDQSACAQSNDDFSLLHWNTVLSSRGTCVKTFIGADPPAVCESNLWKENVMIKVPANEVKQLLNWKRQSPNTTGNRAKTRVASDEGRNAEVKELRKRSRKSKLSKSKAVLKKNNLLMAVSPWVGNVLMPRPSEERVFSKVDLVRTRAENNSLEKTPVFSLLLQALHIDTKGCKRVIVNRTTEVPLVHHQRPIRDQRANSGALQTVSQMLYEKNNPSQNCKLQGLDRPLPSKPLLIPELQLSQLQINTPLNLAGATIRYQMVPQTVITQKTPSVVGSLPAVLHGIPNVKTLSNEKSAQSLIHPTGSSEVPSAETSNGTGTPKRKRKLTAKAQAMVEENKTKGAKKLSANKTKGSRMTPTIALLPKTTAWMFIPNDSVPVAGMQIKTPVAASTSGSSVAPPNKKASTFFTGSTTYETSCNENVNIIPQLPFQSPILVNQNGSLTFLCNIPTPTIPSAAPGVNEATTISSSSGSSFNPVPSSNLIRNVSSASGVTITPCIPSASGASVKLELSQPFISSGNVFLQPSSSSPINLANASFQIGPSLPVGLSTPQAQTQQTPTQTADALKFDANLIFFEHQAGALEWMKGNGGIALPEQNFKIPYLPPFVSNINSLASLLKLKESLLLQAEQLLPAESEENRDEDHKVSALRKLVSDKFKTNLAYSLLKARFLSCFTLPAFLATINPNNSDRGEGSEEEEEEHEKGQAVPKKHKDHSQVVDSLISAKESEIQASEFPGIPSGKSNDGDPRSLQNRSRK